MAKTFNTIRLVNVEVVVVAKVLSKSVDILRRNPWQMAFFVFRGINGTGALIAKTAICEIVYFNQPTFWDTTKGTAPNSRRVSIQTKTNGPLRRSGETFEIAIWGHWRTSAAF